MVNVALVGLGKMGLSHFSLINAHDDVKVVGVCDSSGYVLDVLAKYTGVATYTDYTRMLDSEPVEAVVISTPSKLHAPMVRQALERGLHVFCEKPFCLDPLESAALATSAKERRLVTQVGYHNRFVGAFAEVKRLLDSGALGRTTHVLAEAYGPVVLKAKGTTWRSQKDEGGGALFDYAAHPLDLLGWYFGRPDTVSGTVMNGVFSSQIEDEVYTTINWADGLSGHLSVNWSDESQRKMTTKLTIWGTNGRINVDRQECQVYLREAVPSLPELEPGWNVRYTTELTQPVNFYVRGEEYSAQHEAWVRRIERNEPNGTADFEEAAITDQMLDAILRSDSREVVTPLEVAPELVARQPKLPWWRRRRRSRSAVRTPARIGA